MARRKRHRERHGRLYEHRLHGRSHGGCYLWKGSAHLYDGSSHSLQPALFSYVIETIKGGGGAKEPFRWKNLVNPGMISCVLAIVIYLSGIKLPYILTSSIRMVGSMTGPLAMMLLGSFLLDTDWKSLINQKIIAFTILKMLVLPIVVTLILKQFVDNTYLLAVLMAALATPSGNVIPLLANLYNKEGYPVSVQGVAVTTAAAVITMPVVALVTGLG